MLAMSEAMPSLRTSSGIFIHILDVLFIKLQFYVLIENIIFLRCCCNDTSANSWEDKLPLVEFAINNTVSTTTGYSPFFLDSLAQPLSPHDLAITIPSEAPIPVQNAIQEYFDQYSIVHANAVDNINRAAEINQARFNKTHMPKQFALGQEFLLRTEFIQWTGLTEAGRHFKQPYIGPFIISRVISKGRAYELDFGNLDTRIHPIQPVSRLELYHDSVQAPLPLP